MVSQLVLLHHSVNWGWKLFPDFLARVRSFCREYDSDINIETFEEYLRINFVSRAPAALTLVGVDQDGLVCGHFIAIAEQWFGKKVVTVVQMELDRGTICPPEIWNQGREQLTAFARFHKAELLQITARNSAAARLFARKYGFVGERVVMKRPVEG